MPPPLTARPRPRWAGFGIVALALSAGCLAQNAIPPQPEAPPLAPPGPNAEASVVAPVPQPFALPDIPGKLDESGTDLRSLADSSADRLKQAQFPDLGSTIDQRESEDAELLAGRASLSGLRRAEVEWQAVDKQLKAAKAVLTAHAVQIEDDLSKIDSLHGRWQATLQAAAANATPPALIPPAQAMVDALQLARDQLIGERDRLFTTQEQIAARQQRVAAALDRIDKARETAVGELFVQLNPPLWQLDLSSGIRTGLGTNVPAAFAAEWDDLVEYLTDHSARLIIHAAILVLLVSGFFAMARRIKSWSHFDTAPASPAYAVHHPFASAVVLTIAFGIALYPLPPPAWVFILGGFAMVLAVRILKRMLDPVATPALHVLVVFFFIDQFGELAADAPLIERLLFLVEMLVGISVVLWLLRSRLAKATQQAQPGAVSSLYRTAALAMLSLFVFAFVADFFGFSSLARLIGHGATSAAFLAILIYVLLRILDALFVVALRCRPLRLLAMVKRMRAAVERRCLRVAHFLAAALWCVLTLEFFAIRDPVFGGVESVLTASLRVRDFSISLMDFILFGGVVYLSFLTSKFIKFLLQEEVYPRANLPRGVPFAITTVVHYILLLVGFFIALGLAGIDVTHITVLVGAFGVGIGFGLQNIVNNFVSGLILLFERPLKVGDMVDVNDKIGVLKHIGLRASVLRTLDGSEVIVPNGNLISNPVTNWTLTDQQRRIEIPVGVAYGTDPEVVMPLLLSVAEGHPEILETPAPQALFTGFGESSLNFALRGWTDNYTGWQLISSQMTVEVNRVLKEANITIPFPQRDLHVISMPAPPTSGDD